MSCGQACLLWVFPAGATGRCQGTGKHSGASKLEGGGWNKEEECTSLSVVDVGTRWADSPVKARSHNYVQHSELKEKHQRSSDYQGTALC